MAFISTLTLLQGIKEFLIAIRDPNDASKPLFETVEFHKDKRLREALTSLVIVKQRVALIVPAGDHFENTQDGPLTRSMKSASFDILIADRSWTKAGQEAVMGGDKNLGILAMKDLVVDALVANPINVPGALLVPTEGAEISLADSEVKDSPGRECWVLNVETPAGDNVFSRPTRRF